MTPAELALENAIKLEAKKDALTQRQSGDWKVSFTVQGIDMDPRLTKATPGTRYAMVLVEIGDDELPVAAKESAAQPTTPKAGGARREKMDWRDLQPAAQAGIRCGEPRFQAFLRKVKGYTIHQEPEVAVRDLCHIKSRSELSTNHAARVIWHQIDTEYQAWLTKERVGG